ncbi:TerB family tellurite resistance protein [Rhizobium sp. RU36D]|uniref:tellurite resistance TerB family protein n=1 Tax=Rhizobium sp. RU36D TaxID=1907415 RepID=UPI0009D89312|nr:TerB family tellurite resistance protein [Rhizobium sp. RU36D]SMC76956.1 Uncharacterized conserved protein, tellurite resistance protein B (TerB) family [Rhizobium sp. RU36D]
MLERLQSFFQNLASSRPAGEIAPDDPLIAVAALCIQVMEADGIVLDVETKRLRELLSEQYGLDKAKLDAVLQAGHQAESEAVDYYRFTSDLKRTLDEDQRHQLIGVLWDIVYADGQRNELEDHVVWRVADLLGVSDRERVQQRIDAAARADNPREDDAP